MLGLPRLWALLVGSDEPVGNSLKEYLENDLDFNVTLTTDIAQAVDLLQNKRPDIVLLNQHPGTESGWNLTNFLRQSPEHRDIPVVTMQVMPDAPDMRDYVYQLLSYKVSDIFFRPFRLDTLVDVD